MRAKKTDIKISSPEEDVQVKLSLCTKCGGIVRVAVLHSLTTKSKNEFLKEVFDFDLAVKTQSLLDFRKEQAEWCYEGKEEMIKTRCTLIEKFKK